jgi:hypothetical protein
MWKNGEFPWSRLRLTDQESVGSSFAIGVRDISFALSGVPQDELLQLLFGRASSTPDGRPLVLRTGYHHRPDRGIGPAWSLMVQAVPRSMKGLIRTTLIEDAIPRLLKPWLLARAGLTGRSGDDVLDLIFAPTGSIISQPGPKQRDLGPVLIRKQREKRG